MTHEKRGTIDDIMINPTFLVRSFGLTINLMYFLKLMRQMDKRTEKLLKKLNSDNFLFSGETVLSSR
jgi:hypothetical protein